MKHFSVALLGFGTVGSGVYRIISENGAQISHREGISLSVGRILVRDFEHEPNLSLAPRNLFTTSFDEIINDPAIDIVVECMGGIEPAKSFIIRSLEAGKTVVTSNKEVMSKNWPAFEKAAKATGAGLYLEATVGGGIPIIRTILDSMQANNITRVMGIINGTTNYILTQMTEHGQSFEDALADAQALGTLPCLIQHSGVNSLVLVIRHHILHRTARRVDAAALKLSKEKADWVVSSPPRLQHPVVIRDGNHHPDRP